MPESPFGDETGIARLVGDWAADRVVRPTDPKSSARTPEELHHDAGVTITTDGIGAEAALRVFDTVLVPATRAQDDPMNLAYIPAAPTRAAVAFDLATSAANVFGGIWEAGAGAIFAENEALGWIRDLLGWPSTAGGTFVSGGTSGNLSALHAARATARTRRGSRPEKGWAIACAASAHSSIRSAGSVLDVDVIPVQQDERGRLTGAALRPVLEAHPEICAVVASAGTTNTGTVDDLASISEVCQDLGVWMHVDGAYGGAALAAPSARELFRGIEKADSFIVDPHKWLFAPYDCCALLYREPELARAAHAQHASYLDTIDREATNPSDLAIHLSRRARGLPLWFSLATHGTATYTEAVERSLTTAREVAAYVRDSGHLRLLLDPMLSVVIFDRPGWSEEQYTTWSKHMSVTGQVLCLPTRFRDEMVLRLAFVNPLTETARVIEVLETLR
jgi:glutamate/tyrosine decarboxylase-like PLP-dependent enzyme